MSLKTKNKKRYKNDTLLDHSKSFIESIAQIHHLLDDFIKQIVQDFYNDPGNLYYKIGLDFDIYKIAIYNSKTKKTAIKSYKIDEFLNLMVQKNKFEFEMNKVIRELVYKTENEKDNIILI